MIVRHPKGPPSGSYPCTTCIADRRGYGRGCPGSYARQWRAHSTAAHALLGAQLRGSASAPRPRRVHFPVPQGWRSDGRDDLRGRRRKTAPESLISGRAAGSRTNDDVYPPSHRLNRIAWSTLAKGGAAPDLGLATISASPGTVLQGASVTCPEVSGFNRRQTAIESRAIHRHPQGCPDIADGGAMQVQVPAYR